MSDICPAKPLAVAVVLASLVLVKTSLPPRPLPNPLLEQVRLRSGGAPAPATGPAKPAAITPSAPAITAPLAAPVPSASSTAPATAGQGGVPAWATPGYFHGLQKAGGTVDAGSGLKPVPGGSALAVRMSSMTMSSAISPTRKTTTSAVEQRGIGAALIAQVKRNVAVIAGRPLTPEEIKAAPALHYTRPEHVASIMSSGLRPTEGFYKNLTTWAQDAVYMFPREASTAQKFMNFSTAMSKATAEIEIDLSKLDPEKLYKRVLDGAIVYVSDTPIPPEALRVRRPA